MGFKPAYVVVVSLRLIQAPARDAHLSKPLIWIIFQCINHVTARPLAAGCKPTPGYIKASFKCDYGRCTRARSHSSPPADDLLSTLISGSNLLGKAQTPSRLSPRSKQR